MDNLNLVPSDEAIFNIDELIKDDPEIFINANDPELQCSKFLYAIKIIEQDIEKCQLNAENMINEISKWLEKKINQKQGQIEFMCNYMRNYISQKNLKSLSLPAGNIGFRKQVDKVEITDPDKFMEFATFDIIKVEPEKFIPDISAIKAKLKETGVLPVGVKLITPEPKFYYKINGKEK